MQRPMPRILGWAALCFALTLFTEVTGASLRARKANTGGDDDDGGDDGGGGGLAGALTGMMGGNGEGDADTDDDDPNMVGHKKKKAKEKGAAGGINLDGLENSLATGGVGQLTQMLTAMRAAQSPADTHIKKGANGEDMYDFRDLDDGPTTTMIPITAAPPVLIAPPPAVEVPSMPTISLPGKGGKIKGLRRAQKQAAAAERERKAAEAAGKLVVWPPAPKPQAAVPVPQAVAPVPQAAAPVPQAFVPVPQAVAPMPLAAVPVPLAAAPVPQISAAVPLAALPTGQQAQIGAPQVMAPLTSQAGLYQGLAMMKRNMDMLMSQAMGMPPGTVAAAPPSETANTAPLVARLDQMSQNFKAEEQKIESKVDVLENENGAMRKQLDAQETEIKELEQEKEQNKELRDEVRKAMAAKVGHGTTAGSTISKSAYASAPWEATFSVHLDGKSDGKEDKFTIRVHPEWSPEGAKRFQDIIQAGLLKDGRFFRVVPGFMVQFGIPATPKLAAEWEHKRIKDDPVKQSNKRGMMTFATSGPNTRTTQMFINFANNDFLDKQGFSPFAEVIGDGMDVVEAIQSKYREKPNQGKIQHHGNKYLMKHFPDLSFVSHIDSTLGSAPLQAAGFIQDSETPEPPKDMDRKAYRYGGIATFYHHKVKVGQ